MPIKCQSKKPETCRFHGSPVENKLDAAVRNNDFAAYEQARKSGTPPISANVVSSITSNSSAFVIYDKEPEPYAPAPEEEHMSGWTVPYIAEEYSVRITSVDDYSNRVAVYDDNNMPVIAADVDIYDNMDSTVETLAFIATVLPPSSANRVPESKLKALAAAYPAFKDSTPPQPSVKETTDEVRLVRSFISAIDNGNDPMDVVKPYEETRKGSKFTNHFTTINHKPSLAVAEAYRNA